MTINITKGNIERSIIIGDVVKLGRCLIERLENITDKDIDYIVGIVCFIPDSEEYIDIRLGVGLDFNTVRFKRSEETPSFHSSFKDTEYNEYIYNIDKENQIYFTVL